MERDYIEIEKLIGGKTSIYREEEIIHIFQLYDNYILKGSMIIEEKDGNIVIWSNDLEKTKERSIYEEIVDTLGCDLIVADIDDEEEYLKILELGGEKIEFSENGYNSKFGTLLIKKK